MSLSFYAVLPVIYIDMQGLKYLVLLINLKRTVGINLQIIRDLFI